MELDDEKLELIEKKIEELNQKEEQTRWEELLLQTLEWIVSEEDDFAPPFMY